MRIGIEPFGWVPKKFTNPSINVKNVFCHLNANGWFVHLRESTTKQVTTILHLHVFNSMFYLCGYNYNLWYKQCVLSLLFFHIFRSMKVLIQDKVQLFFHPSWVRSSVRVCFQWQSSLASTDSDPQLVGAITDTGGHLSAGPSRIEWRSWCRPGCRYR